MNNIIPDDTLDITCKDHASAEKSCKLLEIIIQGACKKTSVVLNVHLLQGNVTNQSVSRKNLPKNIILQRNSTNLASFVRQINKDMIEKFVPKNMKLNEKQKNKGKFKLLEHTELEIYRKRKRFLGFD